jgi:ubiquinone biosynthesis protein Coq4
VVPGTQLVHDLFHVLTDYGTDEIGEATLLADR